MKRALLCLLLLSSVLLTVPAVDLSFDSLSLITEGSINDDDLFVLASRAELGIRLDGSDKLAVWIKMRFQSDHLESYFATVEQPIPSDPPDPDLDMAILANDRVLFIDTAAVRFAGIAGTGLELTVFTGILDAFCAGNDFPLIFSSNSVHSVFESYMFYSGQGMSVHNRSYRGIHSSMGTGVRLGWETLNFAPYLYFYQDARQEPGIWSLDARFLFNSENVKLESFVGMSFPRSEYGTYRGGLLFYYDTGTIGEFFAQLGIPYWDPVENLTAESIYFLFEPRINFDPGFLAIAVFFHPAWYLFEKDDQSSGAIDTLLNLGFGNLEIDGISGGIETAFKYRPVNKPGDKLVTITAMPYLFKTIENVQLEIRMGLELLPFPDDLLKLIRPSLGIRTLY